MLVIDASTVCDVLMHLPRASAVAGILQDGERSLHAPSIVTIECMNVARRATLNGYLSLHGLQVFADDLFDLDIELHDFDHAVASRTIELHANFTPMDASYVALAEALDAPLVTSNLRLAKSAARHCEVIAID